MERTVLLVRLDKMALGSLNLTVNEVTEKVIKAINNDRSVTYYNRKTGRRKTSERGMSMIGDGIIANLEGLERWLSIHGKEKNGVYVWNGGLTTKYNSRGEDAHPTWPAMDGKKIDWFKEMNVKVIDLTK